MISFEYLPDELFLFIFRYLHKFDLLYTFTKLNQRFEQIVQPYLSDIDLTDENSPSYRYFRLFYDGILPANLHNIRSLKLVGYHQLQFFRPYMRQFVNLKSISITNAKNSEQHKFLIEVLSQPSLSELSVSFVQKDILKTISSCASINLNKVTLIYSYVDPNLDNVSSMPYIRQLSINLKSVKTLIDLCMLMPNLEELNLSVSNFKDFNETFQLEIPKTLEKLTLEFGSYNEFMSPPTSFQTIQKFVELFKNPLRSLTMIAVNVHNKNFSNYDKVQSLVQKFIRLEKFEYHINTDQQPESDSLFPTVQYLPDSTYSIYTHPKPQQFDTISLRVKYEAEPYSHFTVKQLFNCHTLKVSGQSSLPTSFELTKDFKFINLRKIESDDPIDCCSPEVMEYLAKIITLSPRLDSVRLWRWEGPKGMIDRCHQIFSLASGINIKHVDISVGIGRNANPTHYSTFLIDLSAIFPNAKELKLHIEQQALTDSYTSFDLFIDDLRRNFKKLTYLVFSMWLRDQQAFQAYKNALNKLSTNNSLYYTVIDRDGNNTFYIFNIWL